MIVRPASGKEDEIAKRLKTSPKIERVYFIPKSELLDALGHNSSLTGPEREIVGIILNGVRRLEQMAVHTDKFTRIPARVRRSIITRKRAK